MRLAWSRQDVPKPWLAPYGGMSARRRHKGRFTDQEHLAATGERRLWRYGPHIGPRVRLWQAKDVPEQVMLALLRAKPGRWWTIDNPRGGGPGGDSMPGLVQHAPELAEYPWRVLNAKLASLARRGFVRGCSCGCRGDWHVYPGDGGWMP